MTDQNPTTGLVARLRAPEQWRSFPDPDDDAPREAADEIERLRGALAEIAKATDAGAYFTARRIAAETIEGNDHG